MRFYRWILAAGWLATGGALATAGLAVAGGEPRGPGIGLHLQLASISGLGMLLPHLWTTVYLVGLYRARVADAGRLAEKDELVRCLPVAAIAVAAVILLMGSGAASYSGGVGAWHRIACWVGLAVQAAALGWEGRVLAGHHRRLAAAVG